TSVRRSSAKRPAILAARETLAATAGAVAADVAG
ncbi:MAG: LysR family transcriptional regulator, partial [Arthrobacter sp.]|nr:LysR family transcriptional regulator [Arthrobacter sp.]